MTKDGKDRGIAQMVLSDEDLEFCVGGQTTENERERSCAESTYGVTVSTALWPSDVPGPVESEHAPVAELSP